MFLIRCFTTAFWCAVLAQVCLWSNFLIIPASAAAFWIGYIVWDDV